MIAQEEKLVLLAQSGDQEAFRKLVESYAPLTERVARAMLYNRADAEEAVQDAWLDAWRGLARYDTGRPLRPWLLTIIGNRCRMSGRKAKVPSVPYDDALAEGLLPADAYKITSLTSGGPYRREVQALLGELDEEQRQLLALRFFADLQLDEIAELLRMPLGTVKSRLHRTLQMLRTRLESSAAAKRER